jgi:hypothetical protein
MAAFEVRNVEIFLKINLDETFGIHDKNVGFFFFFFFFFFFV